MKRGQTQAVSFFILTLAILLIVYLIFLPKSEKAEMLGEPYYPDNYGAGEDYFTDDGSSSGAGFRNLLSESPGMMTPFYYDLIQKNLASVNLFSIEDKRYENLATNILLESSLLAQDEGEFIFTVDELDNLEDIKLLFFILDSEGDMTVKLNGFKIMNGEIKSDMLPIILPRSLIKKTNSLILEVDKPGIFEFMSKNSYSLKDVTLIKTYLVQNNYEARSFVLSGSELANLNHMTLVYNLNCMSLNDNGRIIIALNGKPVHDALAVCDAGMTEIDFNLLELVEGRNVMEFMIDKGQYIFENLIVAGDYSQDEFKKYYFMLQVPDMNSVLQGSTVTLQTRFLNDGLRKAGAFYVNGYPIYFDTHFDEFLGDISGLVYEGQNVITTVPNSAFEMITLDVFIS
jgi:hypothetical protein